MTASRCPDTRLPLTEVGQEEAIGNAYERALASGDESAVAFLWQQAELDPALARLLEARTDLLADELGLPTFPERSPAEMEAYMECLKADASISEHLSE